MNRLIFAALLGLLALPAAAQVPNFGNDESDWANDGECDDPRFVGTGMAADLSVEDVGRDATDCAGLFEADSIRLVRTQDQTSVDECAAISFGADTSDWANDRECDDPRFTGPGADEIMNSVDLKADASDCRMLCEAGRVWLK